MEEIEEKYKTQLNRFWYMARLDQMPIDYRLELWGELVSLARYFLFEGSGD